MQEGFQTPDKQPQTYNLQPFYVNERIDVYVSFHDRTMKTLVYVKTDVPELLSEGVCRQLGIVNYNSDVRPGNVEVKTGQDEGNVKGQPMSDKDTCKVPMVQVRLINAVRLLPNQQILVEVKLQWEETAG